RIVLTATGNFGLVDLNQTGQRGPARREHALAQLATEQPSTAVRSQAELALQLQGRDAVGVGGHQVGGPEPRGQRQLGVVPDGGGGHLGLPTAACTFPCPRFGLQLPCFARAAAGAHEALRPARRKKIPGARRFIRKTLLELDQRAGEIAHRSLPKRPVFVFCSTPYALAMPPLIALPEAEAQ